MSADPEFKITEGAEAELEAAADARAAAGDPLEGLAERTQASLEAAFDSVVLDAAARLEVETPQAWVRLKREMTSALKNTGSSLKEWERAIAVQRRARRDEEKRQPTPPPREVEEELVVDENNPHSRLGFGYEMRPGALFRDGRMPLQLTGFSAYITRERVVYDGAEEAREYEIDTHVNGVSRTLRVPAREYATMSWVGAQLGARAWIGAGRGTTDEVRVAIQRLSGEIMFEEAFAMIGWHRHGSGGWRYHHAGGAIGAGGVVEGCTSAPLPRFASLYELPTPPEGEALKSAVRAAAKCFSVHGEVSVAVFSLVWRSILGPSQASIHLAGGPGSGKSELAAIAQRHFGQKMHRRALPMYWRNASDNVLARARNTIGDSVLTIDDLLVRGGRDEEKIADRVDAVFRGGWNGAGMERLTRDGAVRAARPPRSTVLSTGETVPQGYSLRQRVFVIDLERSPNSYAECIANAERGVLAQAMAGFVRWLAPSMDSIRSKLDRLDADEARSFAQHGDRTSQVAGALFVGARSFFRFAAKIGALTEAEADDALAWVRECLGALAARQSAFQDEENPALRFRALVLDALATGRAHLTRCNDGVSAPDNPGAYGWKLGRDVPVAEKDSEGAPAGQTRAETWIAQGDRIGQIHPDHRATILLDPGPALDVARAVAARRGNPLPFSSTTELASRLAKAGLLARDDRATRGTLTVRVRVGGRAIERLWVSVDEGEEGVSDEA